MDNMTFVIGYIIFFGALMYFMAIRPQQKERKKGRNCYQT